MIDLIFDRTLQDVTEALNNPSNNLFLKGAYNYTDLNRVESWCKNIQDIINKIGLVPYPISINTKTNWIISDFIDITNLQRIIDNVTILLEALEITGEEVIVQGFDYLKANAIERNLNLLKLKLEIYKKQILRCGTFYCGSTPLIGEVM